MLGSFIGFLYAVLVSSMAGTSNHYLVRHLSDQGEGLGIVPLHDKIHHLLGMKSYCEHSLVSQNITLTTIFAEGK